MLWAMRRASITILLVLVVFASGLEGQTRGTTGRRPTSKPSAPAKTTAKSVRERPLMQCPSILGNGQTTQRLYCDVLTGTDPTTGLRVTIPPHRGRATLFLTLHNRQTYSESEVKAGRAFARYTATVRASTPAGVPLRDLVVQSEFRGKKDVVEWIGGGAGPGGVKAVAPTGSEAIVLEVPEDVVEVVLLGQSLNVERLGGAEVVTGPGRPIAVVSQVEIEYQPGTPPRSGSSRRR
jgi:hypothetical protein